MFCSQCGQENRNDRKFCSNCGAPLKDYTKPAQNLIMPEDIIKQQTNIEKRNKVARGLNILLSIIFCFAVVFTILLFVLPNRAQGAMTILAIVFDVLFIVVCIVKACTLKKYKNKQK